MPYARSQTAAAQTDTELVAAPGADRQIVVRHVYVSASAAEEVTLESGTTNQRWKTYLAADSNSFAESDRALFRCAPNESLTLTTTATGDTFVSVEYQLARSTGA